MNTVEERKARAAETRKKNQEAKKRREAVNFELKVLRLKTAIEIMQNPDATPSEKLEAAKQAAELQTDNKVMMAISSTE
ncbi:MAG: hypothetical protein IJE74_00930 [Clostridia bacterium]|nr:hypothetical protein [Clostridia bacterium]